MKSRKMVFIALAALTTLLLTATLVSAEPWRTWRGSGGWGAGGQYGSIYNTATVETISGQVVSVEKVVPYRGMSTGVQAVIKTDRETIPVHLGPSWYIERLDTKIAAKDFITVRGSRVTFAGKPAILAAEIKTEAGGMLVLRDANGVPVWAGWRRR